MKSPGDRVANFLLAVAVLGCLGTLLSAWGWYRSATTPVVVADLSPIERQALVEDIVSANPGVLEPAWFEPRIGYTLRRDATLSAWGDSFVSNSLGYRSGPPEKVPGTLRLLFVGDSWTYGMGIKRQESFPEVVADLANAHAAAESKVEAWTLALPGYNTFNQVSALWFFFRQLRPDAVVFCPSGNDNHSSAYILPNGSPWRDGLLRDQFGDPHSVTYRTSRIDSFRFRQRWRQAFDALRQSEERLRSLGVPVMFYFAARWEALRAHYWVEEAGLVSPYVVTPPRLTVGRWVNPPPFGHGTAEANRLYARMVYQGLARMFEWSQLPTATSDLEGTYFQRPPPGDWPTAYESLVDLRTRKELPVSYHRRAIKKQQVAGPLDLQSGKMGRATTILLRQRAATRALRVSLRRLRGQPHLYPMGVRLTIPSREGGSELATELTAQGPDLQTFDLPIPRDLRPGAAIDVIIETELTAGAGAIRRGDSLIIESIKAY